ncbi:DNA repair exonuclease [Rhodosalinus halophilus]|uniref:DNA repair exonuclease n=1 Tax=Rhodosalinus halophilus TaxID=2259333 RepID=A0A365UDH4_9RHOB|nr:metallophosphoesterase [Rhodosalinus halophilus]RBI87505.1 DNA repair exonuclease [Rhodosalinus halophilus]
MTAFRFIHTSDLHLGRRYANLPDTPDGNLRGRLMEARHAAISRLAEAARAHGAADILLAGDTFDSATPSHPVLRQALAAMGEHHDLRWWLLPGNHDNLREAEPLWDTIGRDAPGNVHALVDAAPVDLTPEATLLPCPVAYRSGGTDPTEALATMPSGTGALRIGLAHGGVTDFDDTGATIPPDRDRSARLDYLALGDWHGRLAVGPRVHYSGSPEQDRFRHDRRGVCLAVSLAGPGAPPEVAEIETGTFLWARESLRLTPGQDAAAALEALLPASGRREILLAIEAIGRASLAAQTELGRAAERVGPEFALFRLTTEALATDFEAADLDDIDRAGALRLAADRLRDEAADEELPPEQREIAAQALARLYAIVKEGRG